MNFRNWDLDWKTVGIVTFWSLFITVLVFWLAGGFALAFAQDLKIDGQAFYRLEKNDQGKFFPLTFDEENQTCYHFYVNLGDPAHPAEVVLSRDKVTFITPEESDNLPAINFSLKDGEISGAIVASDKNRLVFEGIFPAEILDENRREEEKQ